MLKVSLSFWLANWRCIKKIKNSRVCVCVCECMCLCAYRGGTMYLYSALLYCSNTVKMVYLLNLNLKLGLVLRYEIVQKLFFVEKFRDFHFCNLLTLGLSAGKVFLINYFRWKWVGVSLFFSHYIAVLCEKLKNILLFERLEKNVLWRQRQIAIRFQTIDIWNTSKIWKIITNKKRYAL